MEWTTEGPVDPERQDESQPGCQECDECQQTIERLRGELAAARQATEAAVAIVDAARAFCKAETKNGNEQWYQANRYLQQKVAEADALAAARGGEAMTTTLPEAIDAMLQDGSLTPSRAEYFRVGRCNHAYCGMRCGQPSGHCGDHSALSESDAPWVWFKIKEGK